MQRRPVHLLMLLLIAVALPLGACGKKGKPQPPSKAKTQASQPVENPDSQDNQQETE